MLAKAGVGSGPPVVQRHAENSSRNFRETLELCSQVKILLAFALTNDLCVESKNDGVVAVTEWCFCKSCAE